jgi:hypothetical protein
MMCASADSLYYIQELWADGSIHNERSTECDEKAAIASARKVLTETEADRVRVLSVDCELVWESDDE